jgi:hypothetical protein
MTIAPPQHGHTGAFACALSGGGSAFTAAMAAALGAAAVHRPHDLELVTAQMTGVTLAIGVAVAPENIRHLQHE